MSEYREIAARLVERQALVHEEATLLGTLAGYSNRMMHFYHKIVAPDELYHIFILRNLAMSNASPTPSAGG